MTRQNAECRRTTKRSQSNGIVICCCCAEFVFLYISIYLYLYVTFIWYIHIYIYIFLSLSLFRHSVDPCDEKHSASVFHWQQFARQNTERKSSVNNTQYKNKLYTPLTFRCKLLNCWMEFLFVAIAAASCLLRGKVQEQMSFFSIHFLDSTGGEKKKEKNNLRCTRR